MLRLLGEGVEHAGNPRVQLQQFSLVGTVQPRKQRRHNLRSVTFSLLEQAPVLNLAGSHTGWAPQLEVTVKGESDQMLHRRELAVGLGPRDAAGDGCLAASIEHQALPVFALRKQIVSTQEGPAGIR